MTKPASDAPTFSSQRQALALPVPDKRPAYYGHASVPGFLVCVMPRTKSGTVRRTWIHRHDVHLPGSTGGHIKTNVKDPLGLVAPVRDGDPVLDYKDALARVTAARASSVRGEARGRNPRMTLASAWEQYETDHRANRSASREKDAENYGRYLAHLKDSYLDELPLSTWSRFAAQLAEGSLVVGKRVNDSGKQVPINRGPLAVATLTGVLNTASALYEIADNHGGLTDVPPGFNPARAAKKGLGAPNKRKRAIPLAQLGLAWRASDALCQPWWRDMWRLYVLTGLRRSLVTELLFREVDFETGTLSVSPHKVGTKRRGKKTAKNAADIRLPLSRFVLDMLRARREFAPDRDGPVWYAVKAKRGGAGERPKQLVDPRSGWLLLEEALGDFHFAPHDLRRTFATAGSASGADLFGVSLLMMHSASTLAKDAGVPGVTVDYIDTDEAQERMRTAAETITAFVLRLATEAPAQSAKRSDPALPAQLVAALGVDED
ncbi:MAG TPA: site-specific integrase [Variovorax sp.]